METFSAQFSGESNQQRTPCATVSETSGFFDQLDEVSNQKMNWDSNEAVKKEKVDREKKESLEVRENQGRARTGRKDISDSTFRKYAAHVRTFKDWLKSKKISENFEQWEPGKISNCLSEFYKESHFQHGGTKKASLLRIIHSAICNHLKSAPYFKPFSLTYSHVLRKAKATLPDSEAAQMDSSDCSTSASPLTEDDICKLWSTGVVGIKAPKSLLRLMVLLIGINFGVTSRRDLRNLTESMFEFKTDVETLLEYVSCNQLKKHKNNFTGRKMFSVPGNKQCPVAALRLFLEKRNPNCSAFFQIPKSDFESNGIWYRAQATGEASLCGMLKEMSREASLSVIYSNNNLRATPPILLYMAMEGTPNQCPQRTINEANVNKDISLIEREHKHPCRDPAFAMAESSKFDDGCMKAMPVINSALQSLEDFGSKQQPSNQAFQQLTQKQRQVESMYFKQLVKGDFMLSATGYEKEESYPLKDEGEHEEAKESNFDTGYSEGTTDDCYYSTAEDDFHNLVGSPEGLYNDIKDHLTNQIS